MAKLSTGELLDAFKELTLLELSDFVKQFEEPDDAAAVRNLFAGAVDGDFYAHEKERLRVDGLTPSRKAHYSKKLS